MNSSTREALWFHLIFFAAAVPVLFLAQGAALGKALALLALAYNLGLLGFALLRGHAEWMALWAFLLPVCLGQALPDLALAQIAGVLVFPDLGQWRIGGEVPVYITGLWMVALFPILLLGNATRNRYLNTALLSLLVFGLAEWAARPLNLWLAQEVRMLAGVAYYVILPEILLGLTALFMYRLTRGRGVLAGLAGSLSVPVFYTGALFISLVLIG